MPEVNEKVTALDDSAELTEFEELKQESDRKLKEAGLIGDEAGTPGTESVAEETEGADITPTAPADGAQPQQEHPDAEQVEPEQVEELEMPSYYGGKYKSLDEFEKAYGEAERKITELSQQNQYLQEPAEIMGKLMRTEEGALAIQRILNPQPAQPKVEIPTDAEGYNSYLEQKGLFGGISETAKHTIMPELQQRDQRIERLENTLNSVLGIFEEQAIQQKYGDLGELKPHLDAVEKHLGERAPYYPIEDKILMARGLASGQTAQPVSEQPKTVPKGIHEQHRKKVLEASAETANVASPEARVIDGSKLSAEEFEKQFGLKRIIRD